jgi:hypothetical protein
MDFSLLHRFALAFVEYDDLLVFDLLEDKSEVEELSGLLRAPGPTSALL